MKPNDLQLAASVDLLGALNGQIKNLQERAAEIKEVLIASNKPEVKGAIYKAAIKFNEPKPSVDYKAIVEDLINAGSVPSEVLEQYANPRLPFYSVSLYDL